MLGGQSCKRQISDQSGSSIPLLAPRSPVLLPAIGLAETLDTGEQVS